MDNYNYDPDQPDNNSSGNNTENNTANNNQGYGNQRYNNNQGYNPYNNQGYNPYSNPNIRPEKHNVPAIISLITGILGLITCMVFYIGLPLSISAIILACISKNQQNGFKGLSIAGLVLGIIGVCLGILFFIIVLYMLKDPSLMREIQNIYNSMN